MKKVNQQAKKIKLDIKKVKLNIKLMMWLLMFSFLWGCGTSTGTGGGGGNPSEGINLITGKLGVSVGFVDVDGDGITDKIIGAPSAAKFSDLGIALVYKGNSTGFDSTYTILTGDNSFGSSFVNLGDADGDSMEDFAIGAIYGDGEDVSMSGAVHIYKGGSNGQTILRKLAGEGPMDRFGISMASGDLNGDGKNDIIIGAPFNTNTPSLYQSGAVYVYFGPDFTTKAALPASSKNKGLGWSVASGDINNDGIADLLISASGKVLGYYGGSSFTPNLDSPDLMITSSATGFGKSIAVMGDVDNDGYKDMVIGAPNAVINNKRDTGSIYIIKGGTGVRTIDLNSSPIDLIVRIDGANLFDRFGASIATVDAGDGDGLIDIAVGAPNADVATSLDTTLIMAGKVYLFKGKDIGLTTTLSNATVFNGDEKYQGYGAVIAPAPDHHILLGMPMCHKYNGHVAMVDLILSGQNVAGSGGGTDGVDDHEHDH